MPSTHIPPVLIDPLKPALIQGHAQKLPVLVRVQAPDPDPAQIKVRKAYHLSLVIDRSGSMFGEPLMEAVRCAKHIIDRLTATDGRAARFAHQLRDRQLNLNDAEFSVLVAAIGGHTHCASHEDLTVLTCWDADRLDLGRVGIERTPEWMCTAAARDPAVIANAVENAQVWLRQYLNEQRSKSLRLSTEPRHASRIMMNASTRESLPTNAPERSF